MEFDLIDTTVRKNQGNVGVARAIYEYTKMGCTVLLPFSDSDKYDLVIDNGDKLLRVQVKTSRNKAKDSKGYNRTGYFVNLVTSGGNTKINTRRIRQESDYDLLFVLLENRACYSIPTSTLGSVGTKILIGSSCCRFENYKL